MLIVIVLNTGVKMLILLILLIFAFIIGFAALMTFISSHVVTVEVERDGNKIIMSWSDYRQRYICPAAYTLTKREIKVETKHE